MLSDAWSFKSKTNNSLLAFKQSTNKFDYVWFIFNKLSHYCADYPRITSTQIRGNCHYAVVMTTRVYTCFTEWYDKFYKNNKKVIPLDLYYYLNYEVLAHWIMGDGTKLKTGLVLQTQSFTVKEVTFIIRAGLRSKPGSAGATYFIINLI